MSRNDYMKSGEIESFGYPFYAIIMAAMRQADTPKPIKARATTRPANDPDRENRYAPSPAKSSRKASIRRGPKRSSSTPNGNCDEAKEIK